jgi:hypothetical protein
MIEASPTTRMPIISASASCVPATFRRPARVPWVRLLATIRVTVGPGTMAIRKQATR